MAVETVLGNISNAAKGLVILFSSMAPFVENKGSILLAAALHLKWYLAYFASSIGSFLPIPFLLHSGDKGKKRLEGNRVGKKFTSSADRFINSHRRFFDRYGCFALLLIVSVPFTGVGCWLAAFLSKVNWAGSPPVGSGNFFGDCNLRPADDGRDLRAVLGLDRVAERGLLSSAAPRGKGGKHREHFSRSWAVGFIRQPFFMSRMRNVTTKSISEIF